MEIVKTNFGKFSESLDDEDNSSVCSTQTVDKKVVESQNVDKKVVESRTPDNKVIESQNGDRKSMDKKLSDVDIKMFDKKVSVKKVDSAPISLTSFKGSGRNYFYVSFSNSWDLKLEHPVSPKIWTFHSPNFRCSFRKICLISGANPIKQFKRLAGALFYYSSHSLYYFTHSTQIFTMIIE